MYTINKLELFFVRGSVKNVASFRLFIFFNYSFIRCPPLFRIIESKCHNERQYCPPARHAEVWKAGRYRSLESFPRI